MDWYLIAYDVRDERRMKRLHRYLTGRGKALQRSLFLVRGSRREVAELLAGAEEIADPGEDDLRLYPIDHPSRLWLHGAGDALAAEGNEGGGMLERFKAGLQRLWKGKGDG